MSGVVTLFLNRILMLAGSAAFATLAVFTGISYPAQGNPDRAHALLDSANRERAARGLPALLWDEDLARAARQHTQIMRERNVLSHQFPGEEDPAARARRAGARFSKSAENIGFAPSTEVIHSHWMKSPPHRANILDAEFDRVGIAVLERDGLLFAAQDFSRSVAPLAIEEQEKKIAVLLSTRGLHLLNNIPSELEVARRQCALDSGTPHLGQRRSVTVFRLTTIDLNHLPANVDQTIHAGQYHSAAVGACASDNSGKFASYRIAILLY